MSKHTPGPWGIDWYICRSSKGKEMWRVPRSIGPAGVDHNHWSGDYITVDEADARLIAIAPMMYEYIASSASNGCAEAKKIIAKAEGNIV